ncbi:MAG: DUF4358 domain-containing protein [Firmicutes bacterium]|nr:DUF4358 domain-containing protein [Bacillota bacterium]
MFKKRFLLIILALILALGLCACGDSNVADSAEPPFKEIKADIEGLAAELLEGVAFEDELFRIDDEMISLYYEIPEGGKGVFYYGSGATAEEIAVFELADGNQADEFLIAAQEHIADQILSYEDYIPKEVVRLEQAVVECHGKYVVVCVAADTKTAEHIIDQHILNTSGVGDAE